MFEASLVYKERSRTARVVIQRNSVSKNPNKGREEEREEERKRQERI